MQNNTNLKIAFEKFLVPVCIVTAVALPAFPAFPLLQQKFTKPAVVVTPEAAPQTETKKTVTTAPKPAEQPETTAPAPEPTPVPAPEQTTPSPSAPVPSQSQSAVQPTPQPAPTPSVAAPAPVTRPGFCSTYEADYAAAVAAENQRYTSLGAQLNGVITGVIGGLLGGGSQQNQAAINQNEAMHQATMQDIENRYNAQRVACL